MHMTLRVAVAGATGYAGGEALRLVAGHPDLTVGPLCAGTARGPIEDYQPHLQSLAGMQVSETRADLLAESDIAILGLPHGASAKVTSAIEDLNPDCLIVDLGADHRLASAADWEAYYGTEAAEPWTYGMPELIREEGPSQRELLAASTRIAAPGCNASAITFAAQPAIAAGLSEGTGIVASLAVGYSGAGKSLKPHLLASEGLGNAVAYGVGGSHRHIPEIAQNLQAAGGHTASLVMTPVLVPMSRGILATVSIPAAGTTQADVLEAYTAAYASEPFINVTNSQPATASVLGSNGVLICPVLDRDGERITVTCAIDNLGKGTAGAAIQSINLALGLEETTGLTVNGVAP